MSLHWWFGLSVPLIFVIDTVQPLMPSGSTMCWPIESFTPQSRDALVFLGTKLVDCLLELCSAGDSAPVLLLLRGCSWFISAWPGSLLLLAHEGLVRAGGAASHAHTGRVGCAWCSAETAQVYRKRKFGGVTEVSLTADTR